VKEESMFYRNLAGFVLCAGLLLLGGNSSLAAQAPGDVRNHHYDLTGESIGLVGYDPVSYFVEGGGHPQKGLFKLSFVYDGVTYRFATQANLDLFKTAPTRFLPQFGGWCTWALGALNQRFDIDPECYVVQDGKLYLFYRDPGLDTRELWLKDSQSLLQKAQANWPDLSK
jgi:YHS domain-containing protein